MRTGSTRRPRRRRDAEDVLVRHTARRLGLQAAAFVAVVVLLVVAAATAVLLRAEDRSASDLLTATVALADDVEDPPLDVWLVLHRSGRVETTAGLPAGADDPAVLATVAAGGSTVDSVRRVRAVDYRVRTVRRPDGVTVQAVLDLAARERDRSRVLAAMLLTGTLGLLAAAAVGTWTGRRALRPLSGALALQRRFVADAGHELRTPLTLLTTRAQLLRRRLRRIDEATDPRRAGHDPAPGIGPAPPLDRSVAELARRDVEGIVADSTRLTAILEDLLLAADPLARRAQVPVDLAELARAACDAGAPDALDHGVTLVGPASDHSPVPVLGAAAALHRALTALIDNAVRHAHRSVAVTVAGDREARVDVTDDGPGVDAAVAPRLFTRFAGGPPTTPTGPRRYGLGLALVAEIAAAHGGRVELLDPPSRSAGGTILRVTLPLHRSRRG